MSNLERIVRARILQNTPTPAQPTTNLERIVEGRRLAEQSEDPEGFLSRANRFIGNVFLDPDFQAERDLSFGISPRDISQLRGMAVGAASPILGGVEALMQIPGFFTDVELPTDRAAHYLERLRVGLLEQDEEAAIRAGMDPTAIADAHMFGEMVGYTAPVVASLKAARMITGIRGPITGLVRNFKLDTAAGLIFGSTLLPEEEVQQRFINASREAALFGVGGLMINGLIFAATGMRYTRAAQLNRERSLAVELNRIANGEGPILSDDGVTIAQLMSEEGFLASSPEAQAILERGAVDAALVEAIRGTAEAGMSRGFARQIGPDFRTAADAVDRFREQFPGMKFDIIKRGAGEFDVHFGLTGLNNSQKAQLAREGRFAGQMIQKGSSPYIYVRQAKGDRIVVRTVDGRTTTLKNSGVTDLPTGVEDVPLPGAGQALYEDFREFAFGKIRDAGAASGGLSETDIIRFIRQQQLGLADDVTRTFEVPGAITHPSEIGAAAGEGATSTEQFVEQYLREGAQGNGLLEPEPIRRFDDVFEAWLRERSLAPSATDIEAFKTNFMQRMRSDLWALVPEADMATMRTIQEETFRLIEAQELPFEVLAGSKGFHVERGERGVITLRDINTGTRLRFANEEVAHNSLLRVVRAEKDSMFDFITPGAHGGQALTTGLDPSDGIYALEGNVHAGDFRLFESKDIPMQTITNRRDYLEALERGSGVPIFNEGYALVDEGLLRMDTRLTPIQNKIESIWKGLNRQQKRQVADFWTDIEGTELSGVALVRAAKDAGLSGKQITAFTEARKMFDLAAQQRGLDRSRYIPMYYSRIRPEFEATGRANVDRLLRDSPGALKEFQDFAEMNRTGEMALIELDPEIVMHKHFRSLIYSQEVSPAENQVRRMMEMRVGDLTAEQRASVLQRALPGTSDQSYIFPEEVRKTLQEYLNSIRGDMRPGFAAARRVGVRVFSKLGIDIDPQVMDELYYTMLSIPYGAAMGLRMVILNRNATQNLWNMYTRVGGQFASESLSRAMTQAGFDEALAAQAIREFSQSLPEADAIFQAFYNTDIARGRGPLSNAAASVIRRAIRLGRVTRKTAQQFLVPYGSGEQINRAWAYHWQKMHTLDKLAEFDAGRLDWDGFLEEGLPFFSDSIKRGFRQRMDKLGREAAVQWIGKQAADEGHFIYNATASPMWMQTYFGKLGGMFGQWSLWQKQLYFNRMAHATPKQFAAFWARTAAITGAFTNLGLQTGVNITSWLAPLSLGFTGGPALDIALTARDVWGGPLDQKATAARRLAGQIGSLSFPGQLFYNEIGSALDETDPAQAALRLTLGRSADSGNFQYDIISNPNVPGSVPEAGRIPRIEGLPPIR